MISDFETASSTLSATMTPCCFKVFAREVVRLWTIKGGNPSFAKYFWRLSAIAKPMKSVAISGREYPYFQGRATPENG